MAWEAIRAQRLLELGETGSRRCWPAAAGQARKHIARQAKTLVAILRSRDVAARSAAGSPPTVKIILSG
jgi:hypothetical protein